ncbi:DNA-binding response regulator [Nocardia panacis]|uniref:DNA-binding response regulator n=1 Tax=Nocardia panacis TaxID=2340916 RepID=A0A3A4JV25_9NOCA|nr:response regulator transcription factor [Nocardia panacis]RJO70105.1 DNA-binding response regulator [Nocardia panacis]
MITVMLVDDHPMVREGLRSMLDTDADISVVAEAGSGEEALASIAAVRPDVVLMDLRMPGLDGATTTERILGLFPGVKIVVVTTYETDSDILRAVESGAVGYLLKGATRAELTRAVRSAARGETVLAPSVAGRLFQHARKPIQTVLSARELEVLACVARGMTNQEIGSALRISEATVKTHLSRAFAKLDVSDRTAAVTTAIARGLLTGIHPTPRSTGA